LIKRIIIPKSPNYATVCDFEAKYGENKYTNDGFYGISLSPDNGIIATDTKRSLIGLLGDREVENLNQLEILTKFWRRLY
jgi:hypothetical protein